MNLYLDENQLTGEIPASLGNFTKLTQLFLGGNQLTGDNPGFAGQPHYPAATGSQQQPVDGEDPGLVGQPHSSCATCTLTTNQLSGPIPDLSRLTNLLDLYLWEKPVETESIPDWLDNLTNLQYLDALARTS